MESRFKILGHPAHQILVPFPVGALGFSFVFDAAYVATGRSGWAEAGNKSLGAGLLSAMVAAPFGLVDWLAIPAGTRAKEVGRWHGVGNLVMAGLFGASWLARRGQPGATKTSLALSSTGFLLSFATAWLGGELVSRHKIGVETESGLNAPSSMARSGIVEAHIPSPATL